MAKPTPAAKRPIARVAVDVSLPHLDRPFDYLVPDHIEDQAIPGCRVRVRFSGKLVDGFLLDRVDSSEHHGKLAFLTRVVSPEPVLTPEIVKLSRWVADRYAGNLADVLRLAIPPRHGRVEGEETPSGRPSPEPLAPRRPDPWGDYPDGPRFLAALANGRPPRAVWSTLPGVDWPLAVAVAVRATLSGGRGALVVVPDGRDAARVDAACAAELGTDRHVVLTSELGPAERYRRWLRALRGEVRAVVGTRAAMFAPVADLGLVVVWDDGDDLHAERRAPYPHAREVLGHRADAVGAGALFGGYARSCEMARLLAAGWAKPLEAAPKARRQRAPRIRASGDDDELAHDEAAWSARLPSVAWRAARDALANGPVLVQVPRRGYVPAVACERCRASARCPACSGPLALPARSSAPRCRWCGHIAEDWRCRSCEWSRMRALTVGAARTAEELGRAFPSVPIRLSGRDGVVDRIGSDPVIVVATPGAEPQADGGYAAALLLDGAVLLARPDLRAAEETLRRWMNAAALVRSAEGGGRVVVLADGSLPVVQSLLRWDPAGYAERELRERGQLGFPPVSCVASVTGPPHAVRDLLQHVELPERSEVLGPVEIDPPGNADQLERALVRGPRSAGRSLSRALREASAVRTARRSSGTVRIQIDPLELG